MKKYLIIPFTLFHIIGCYTLINHPAIEVYYERENELDSLSEDYEVYVDENCGSCHDGFLIQKHFSPMLSTQNVSVNWNNLPWWFDTKYLHIFSGNQSPENTASDTYQHVQSQQRPFGDTPQSGGYLPSASGGGSVSSGVLPSKSVEDGDQQNKRKDVTPDKNKSRSDSKSGTTKRKFRKRR